MADTEEPVVVDPAGSLHTGAGAVDLVKESEQSSPQPPSKNARQQKKKKKQKTSYKFFMRAALQPSEKPKKKVPVVHARFPKLKDRL